MNKKIIIGLVAVLVIGGGIYYKTSQNKTTENVADSSTNPSHETTASSTETEHSMSAGEHTATGATLAGTRVILKNTALKSGTQNLSFELYGEDGDAWSDKDLKIAHEKKMHFIMVSSDFSEYQHVHPEFKDKLWQVQVGFKNNMTYQAYVDIDSTENGAETLRLPVTIGTPQALPKVAQKETSLTKDGVTVLMNVPNGFVSGQENTVTFTITKNGKAIIPENYLGAKGHVVALGDDPNTFIHGHPSEDSDVGIDFAFEFEKAGTHTLFAQFQVGGVVRTYPFTITVTGTTGRTNESMPHTDTVPHN